MLQDVLELRRNKWVPRSRQSTSLKTIDQVLVLLLRGGRGGGGEGGGLLM